jgi:hypothetical protein
MKRNTFWKKKWHNKVCGITQSRLRPGKNKYGLSYSIFLDCNHGFYRSALTEWIRKCPSENPTCPICRSEFESICVLF